MRELNIHFTIYTKDMQTKSVKNPLYFINKICFLSSSFGTKSKLVLLLNLHAITDPPVMYI